MRQEICPSVVLLAGTLLGSSDALAQDPSVWGVQGVGETEMREVTVPAAVPVATQEKDVCGWKQEQRMAAAKAVAAMNETVEKAILGVTGSSHLRVPLDLGSLLSGGYHTETYSELGGQSFAFGQRVKTKNREVCDDRGTQSVLSVNGSSEARFVLVWTQSQLDALSANGVLADVTRDSVATLSSFDLTCQVDRVTATVTSRFDLPSWLGLTCALTDGR